MPSNYYQRMPKKIACLILSFLILFKTVPLEAAVRGNAYKVGNGEKAVGIAEEFFDGANLDPTASIKTTPRALDVRQELKGRKAVSGAFGESRGGTDPAPPSFSRPVAPYRDNQKPSGTIDSKQETPYCDAECENRKYEDAKRKQKLEQEQYDKNWSEANSVTEKGYYLTILGSLFLGAAGFIFGLSAVATGGMFLGGLFTLAATMKSGPTGFHEFIGALAMSPIALAWGIGSGALEALTFGKIKPSLFKRSNPKGAESLLAALERGGRIAGQAVALAGAGALALGSTGVIALPIALSPVLGLGVAGLAVTSSAYRVGDWYFGEKKPQQEINALRQEHLVLVKEEGHLREQVQKRQETLLELQKKLVAKLTPIKVPQDDGIDEEVMRENEDSSVMYGWPAPPKTKEEVIAEHDRKEQAKLATDKPSASRAGKRDLVKQLKEKNSRSREMIESLVLQEEHAVRMEAFYTKMLKGDYVAVGTKHEHKSLMPLTGQDCPEAGCPEATDADSVRIKQEYPDDPRALQVLRSQDKLKESLPFTIYVSRDSLKAAQQTTAGFLEPRASHEHMGSDNAEPRGSALVIQEKATVVFASYYLSGEDKNKSLSDLRHEPQNPMGDSITKGLGNAVVLQPEGTLTRLYLNQHLGDKEINLKDAQELIDKARAAAKRDKKSVQAPVIPGKDCRYMIDKGCNPGIFVKAGDTVEPGTPIGTIGNTGRMQSSRDPAQDMGTHQHIGVIEVDAEKNPRMKALRDGVADPGLCGPKGVDNLCITADQQKEYYHKIREAYFMALGYEYNKQTNQITADSLFNNVNRSMKVMEFIVKANNNKALGNFSAAFMNPWEARIERSENTPVKSE